MRYGGLIAALLLFLALTYGVRGYVIDDTFIHLQYAKNLKQGFGLVFNPGEPVAGTTSPMWSVLLGWLPSFGIELVLWSKLLGWFAAVASLVLFWWIAGRFRLSSAPDGSGRPGSSARGGDSASSDGT